MKNRPVGRFFCGPNAGSGPGGWEFFHSHIETSTIVIPAKAGIPVCFHTLSGFRLSPERRTCCRVDLEMEVDVGAAAAANGPHPPTAGGLSAAAAPAKAGNRPRPRPAPNQKKRPEGRFVEALTSGS